MLNEYQRGLFVRQDTDFLEALLKVDRRLVTYVLDDIRPFLTRRFMIMDEAAARYGLMLAGGQLPSTRLVRLVIAIDGMISLDHVLKDYFLIHHLHLPGRKSKFRIVLAHKMTGFKIDMIPWQFQNCKLLTSFYDTGSLLPGRQLAIADLSTQFAITVYELALLEKRRTLDFDHEKFALAASIKPYVDMSVADHVWQSLVARRPSIGELKETFEFARLRNNAPENSKARSLSGARLPQVCAKCASLPSWPIASTGEVYSVPRYIFRDVNDLIY